MKHLHAIGKKSRMMDCGMDEKVLNDCLSWGRMRCAASIVLALTGISGCTTVAHIKGSQGEPIVMIECGAATSFSICYSRAAKECPSGYRTIEEDPGFNRKTLKVACDQ